MKHIHITLLAVVILSGCKGAEPLVPFNSSEFSRFDGVGKATIEGQAFAKTRGGDIKYPAGDAVYLVPATTHTTDWIVSNPLRYGVNWRTSMEVGIRACNFLLTYELIQGSKFLSHQFISLSCAAFA